ncbi:MAG: hypothetical protein PHE52_00795 [Candidatus Pacebacteria bacterium]|nr:hypothetical protein [Candidatus Paceibacterota bacterium]
MTTNNFQQYINKNKFFLREFKKIQEAEEAKWKEFYNNPEKYTKNAIDLALGKAKVIKIKNNKKIIYTAKQNTRMLTLLLNFVLGEPGKNRPPTLKKQGRVFKSIIKILAKYNFAK